jgi:hypothetical protein
MFTLPYRFVKPRLITRFTKEDIFSLDIAANS